MTPTMRRFYVVAALLLLVGGIVFATLLEPIVGTRTDFSVFNSQWNGASGLGGDVYRSGGLVPSFTISAAEGNVSLAQKSLDALGLDPATSSLVIVGPQAGPSAAERAWLRDFAQRGGRILLADKYGHGNEFLDALGARSRFDGRPMLGLAYAKRAAFVVAQNFSASPLTAGIGQIVMNHPTALRPDANATVLASTDASAWLDLQNDGVRDAGDPLGPFPWMASETVGQGSVVLVSDPSLFINGMRPVADDAKLVQNLVSWLHADGRGVAIDESHHDYQDPVRFLGVTLRSMPTGLRVGLALVGGGAMFLVSLGPNLGLPRLLAASRRLVARFLPPPEEDAPDVVAAVKRRHPDWDENDLRRIQAGWERP